MKPGSPEKPISDLGLQAYMSYWTTTLVRLLKERKPGALFGCSAGFSLGSLR
jgi:hypothetical protein